MYKVFWQWSVKSCLWLQLSDLGHVENMMTPTTGPSVAKKKVALSQAREMIFGMYNVTK